MAGCGNVAKVFVSDARRVQVTTEPQMRLAILPQVFRQKYQVAADSCPLGSCYSKHQPCPGPSWKCRITGLTNMWIQLELSRVTKWLRSTEVWWAWGHPLEGLMLVLNGKSALKTAGCHKIWPPHTFGPFCMPPFPFLPFHHEVMLLPSWI